MYVVPSLVQWRMHCVGVGPSIALFPERVPLLSCSLGMRLVSHITMRNQLGSHITMRNQLGSHITMRKQLGSPSPWEISQVIPASKECCPEWPVTISYECSQPSTECLNHIDNLQSDGDCLTWEVDMYVCVCFPSISGAVRISLLTGRVLFKDAHYYCRDYSIR